MFTHKLSRPLALGGSEAGTGLLLVTPLKHSCTARTQPKSIWDDYPKKHGARFLGFHSNNSFVGTREV